MHEASPLGCLIFSLFSLEERLHGGKVKEMIFSIGKVARLLIIRNIIILLTSFYMLLPSFAMPGLVIGFCC